MTKEKYSFTKLRRLVELETGYVIDPVRSSPADYHQRLQILSPEMVASSKTLQIFIEAGKERARTSYTDAIGCKRVDFPLFQGISFHCFGHSGVYMVDDENKAIMGVVNKAMPYMNPEYLGQGHGPKLYIVNEFMNLRLMAPGLYSESGFATRMSAHRQMIEYAIGKGLGEVCNEEAMQEYREKSEVIEEYLVTRDAEIGVGAPGM